MREKRAIPTFRYDQQIDGAGRENYWRLFIEVVCPDCNNIFWANYATMHMNGKGCPRCGELLEAPGRVDYNPRSIQVDMPDGALRWGSEKEARAELAHPCDGCKHFKDEECVHPDPDSDLMKCYEPEETLP